MPASERAHVVASFGRHLVLRMADGTHCGAVVRGRRTDVCVGDLVDAARTSSGQAVIDAIVPRRNEIKRSDAHRTKRLAANVDRIAMVIAPDPPFSEELLVRVLCDAHVAGIEPMLVTNKADLHEALARAAPRIGVYERLGYEVVHVSAKTDPLAARARLLERLRGRTTLLLGQSGMGKSTIVNLLVPDAALATQAISTALGTGRHTTTFTRCFALPGDEGWLIDSPGFQTFGLAHLTLSQLMHAMPEFAPLLGCCRFNNCTHRTEPGCAIADAVARGGVDARRWALYRTIADELAYQASMPARS